MERAWLIVSILCLLAALIFWVWRDNVDATFVAATLGGVAWFLSLRNGLRRSSIEHSETNLVDESDSNQDEA
jgi:uncharacterized membrane protein YdjX (TVP38/TMEM64 family)